MRQYSLIHSKFINFIFCKKKLYKIFICSMNEKLKNFEIKINNYKFLKYFLNSLFLFGFSINSQRCVMILKLMLFLHFLIIYFKIKMCVFVSIFLLLIF